MFVNEVSGIEEVEQFPSEDVIMRSCYAFITGDLANDRHKDTMKKKDDADEIVEFN